MKYNFSSFTNLYSLTKTLRFELKPTEKTKELLKDNTIIQKDKEIDRLYHEEMKPLLDKLHNTFIEESLQCLELDLPSLEQLKRYLAELQELNDKKTDKRYQELTDEKKGLIPTLLKQMRLRVKEAFKEVGKKWQLNYKNSKKTNEEILTEESVLELLKDKFPEKSAVVEKFKGFFTYFSGFNQNRLNYYHVDNETGVPKRTIDVNMVRYIKNILIWEKWLSTTAQLSQYKDIFTLEGYNNFAIQSGIDTYNKKVGEVNFFINQELRQKQKLKAPLLQILYKQIGSPKAQTFVKEIKPDNEWSELKKCHELVLPLGDSSPIIKTLKESVEVLGSNDEQFERDKIYLNTRALTTISSKYFTHWNILGEQLKKLNLSKLNNGEYSKPREISLNKLKEAINYADKVILKESLFSEEEKQDESLSTWDLFVKKLTLSIQSDILKELKNTENLIADITIKPYKEYKSEEEKKQMIKNLKKVCDSYIAALQVLKYFIPQTEGLPLDSTFYSSLDEVLKNEREIINYYNAFRNYVTKKPYILDKIKLNFDCGYLLSGWSQGYDYETYGAYIFCKDNKFYLAISTRGKLTLEEKNLLYSEDVLDAQRLVYFKQPIDNKNPPRWFIRSKQANFAPLVREGKLDPKPILDIYDNELFSKTANPMHYKVYLPKLIHYFKKGFLVHPDFKHFAFEWLPDNGYDSIADFYHHTAQMAYKLEYEQINFSGLEKLVEKGRMYLFEICNKDLSHINKKLSRVNSHTLIFRELLNPENRLKLQLLGGGEIFFRDENKNLPKKKIKTKDGSEFETVEHKRFSEKKYFLHFPIHVNGTSERFPNDKIKSFIRLSNDFCILGIDRGEKNLLYYSLVDHEGKLMEQGSWNIINGVDYNARLSQRAGDMMEARKNWQTIGKIKEFKEGYLSQVVYEVAKIIRNNFEKGIFTFIALEDLNSEFKAKRLAKVEKSIYKKFEIALAKKLNHLFFKDIPAHEVGGVLNAYQLTPLMSPGEDKKLSDAKIWGNLMKVRANYTSTTDPLTGWRKTVYLHTANKEKMLEQFNKEVKDMYWSSADNAYVIKLNGWDLYTIGERLYNVKQNGSWKSETYNLNEKLNNLFSVYGIDKNMNIKNQITGKASNLEAKFFSDLFFFINLTQQIRNSDSKNNLDYILSPVKPFYDSRKHEEFAKKFGLPCLPCDADANGAFNIARKGLVLVSRIQNGGEEKMNTFISDAEWDEWLAKNLQQLLKNQRI